MKLNPLRGSSILAISKLIYAFLNNWFGGATSKRELRVVTLRRLS